MLEFWASDGGVRRVNEGKGGVPEVDASAIVAACVDRPDLACAADAPVDIHGFWTLEAWSTALR